MWLLREKLSDFGVKQTLYRVDIALYVQTKNSLGSHLWAIMALDHRQRGKQIRPNFLRSTSLQILANTSGCVQTAFSYFFFLYTTSEDKEYYDALIIQTSYKTQYFTIFQDKLHSFNNQDHRRTRGLLISKTVQKMFKITYTASRF